jgi:hypothetical protein
MEEGHTMPFRPIEIQLAATSYAVAPGDSLAIPLTLINHTGRDDYFEMTVRGVAPGWVFMDIPVIHLAPGEQRETSLTVQPPAGSAGNYALIISVADQSDPNLAGEASLNLAVAGTVDAGYAATQVSPPASRIGLALDAGQYSVLPGNGAAIQARIANNGYSEDTFYVTLEGFPLGWLPSPEATLRLRPGEEQVVSFFVQPPQTPTSRAGRHPFLVRVRSQLERGQAMVIDSTLTVAAFSQFTADLNPRRIDAGQTARLRIFNLGNIQSTYSISWQPGGRDLEFVQNEPGPVRVMPGETAAVDFVVSPRSPNLFGGTGIRPYTVVITSSEGEAQAYNGDMVNRALIPVWVLPALLVLCVTALCGVGFLWNWNQSRLTYASQTADANAAIALAATSTASINQTAAVGNATIAAETTATTAALSAATLQAATLAQQAAEATAAQATLEATDAEATAAAGTLVASTQSVEVGLTMTADAANAATQASAAVVAQTATAAAVQTAAAAAVPTTTSVPPTNTPRPATATPTQAQLPLPVTGAQFVLFVSDQGGTPDLYLFSAADGKVVQMNIGNGPNTQPAWSPDGGRIAFVSGRDGNNEIYVMDADGGNLKNLTNNPADDSFPSWSPDGNSIAFATNRDGNYEIYSMSADGSKQVNLTNSPGDDTEPAWYAERGLLTSTQHILFATNRDGNYEIYTMKTDGSDPTNLTKNPASDSLPAIRDGGGRVAFVSDRDGNNEVYGMDPNGANPVNLTKNPASDTMPRWSPDNKQIIFATDRDGNPEIYVMGADGSNPANLSRSPAAETYPAWR